MNIYIYMTWIENMLWPPFILRTEPSFPAASFKASLRLKSSNHAVVAVFVQQPTKKEAQKVKLSILNGGSVCFYLIFLVAIRENP